MFGFGSGDDVTLTMNKPHPKSLLDTGVQNVIGKPLSRVDGPRKVSGKATYAAEYKIENLAYGVLVGATIGKGKVASVDADAVKAIPGVLDVVVDFDTFIRVSQQGGEDRCADAGRQAGRVRRTDHRNGGRRELRSRARRRRSAADRV